MKARTNKKYKSGLRFLLWCSRRFSRKKVMGKDGLPEGGKVYLCRHSGANGVVNSLAYLPDYVRPWTLHIFCTYKEGYRHLKEYTFKKRFKLGILAAPLAAISSLFISSCAKSAGSVPVYRDGRAVITLKKTVRLLESGESIVIYPDVEYDQKEGGGTLYEGYHALARLYFKVTGNPLPLVPVTFSKRECLIHPPFLSHGNDEDKLPCEKYLSERLF